MPWRSEVFLWQGFDAQWVCAGDGTMVLWVFDPGDDYTPPTCEPYGEDTCTCPTCKENAAPGWHPKAA